MAFGATDKVETTAWRSQDRRPAEAWRAADSKSSRFDSLLSKPDPVAPRRVEDRPRAERREVTQDRPATETRDKPKPRATTDDGPRAARDAGDTTSLRDRAQAKDDGKTSDTKAAQTPSDTETTASATQAKGEAAKAEGGKGGAVAGEAVATPVPTPFLPIQASPVQTAPTAADASGTDPAIQQAEAVAGTAAKAAEVPQAAGPGGTDAAKGSYEGKAGAEAKEFLAVMAQTGQDAGKADAPAPSAPQGGATQGVAQATSTAPAAQIHAAQAAPPAPPPVPLGQVPMTIGLRSLAGSSEFQIRLDPIELGRIDVKLEIDKAKGTVATHLVVDRPDTLALLQRDAGQLQQALAQAGLDSSASGINLSLRGDGGGTAGGQNGQAGGDGRPQTPWGAEGADIPADAAPYQRLRGYGGLDIRI
ncbi:flagellar hook-length control protein FliK [Methylobacterium sp. NFXW15]|uniref:flagellar hook-length control protein FliK n=1 Tax=Methylobacterium sp. NFXW15 TaxID=2819512 RepID=UPI003CE84203